MPLRFVIGRAGTGKTRHCFDQIVEMLRADPLGPAIYWLLPRQATFQAERDLACNSGLPGFCRVRVVSFERLGQDILSDCGGVAIPHVGSLGRQMILGHLLRKHTKQLKFFSAVAHQSGLPKLIDSTFAELDRSGHDAETIGKLLAESFESTDAQNETLRSKLADLKLLHEAYTAYLGQDRLDPARRLEQVLDSVEKCSFLKGATIFVDAFFEFTDYERRLLTALAKGCDRVDVTLLLDPNSPTLKNPHAIPDELDLFHRTERTYRQLYFLALEEDVEILAPKLLTTTRRFESEGLKEIESNLFDTKHKSTRFNGPGISLSESPDRRAEVDAVARGIRALLAKGHRLRDIAVLMRDLDAYLGLIDASFREHEIPFFADHRRTAAHHPLIQFARSALQIAQNDWPHDAVITLFKTGLCAVNLSEADELENYALLHGIRGGTGWASESPWAFSRTITREENDLPPLEQFEIQRIDATRRKIADRLTPFVKSVKGGSKNSVRQTATELFKLFDAFDVRTALTKWMRTAGDAQEFEQQGEHQQVWTELVDLLEQMVELLGDEQLKLADFIEVLESGLEGFDLALMPPTVDQVLVGPIDRTRTPPLAAVFLLGLNEGEFPRAASEDHVLSDAERRRLREQKIDLDPDAQRRLFDERLLGYLAVTRASKSLAISRPMADDKGRPQNPSPFWRQIREKFPQLEVNSIPRDAASDPNYIGTPRQLVVALMRWASDPNADRTGQHASLYNWLARHECTGDAIDTMRFRAWRALSYHNEAKLSPLVANRLFSSPLRASVTQIETFAACPFKHYARYGLRLEPRPTEEVTALDLGNCYHQILEKIVREIVAKKIGWADLQNEPTKQLIAECALAVGQALRGEVMLSTARNQYLRNRIEPTVNRVVAQQRTAAQFGKFKPFRAELTFGLKDDDGLAPLRIETPKGKELLIRGKIDRVDLIEERAEVAVIDYKLRGNALKLDQVYHGLALQLLTYLLVLQANGQKLAGKKLTPVAAFYMRLIRSLERVKRPDDERKPEKPRGIFEAKSLRSFDSQVTEKSTSEVLHAYITKDGKLGSKSDGVEARVFNALLEHVNKRLGELADEVLTGDVRIAPYRLQNATACAQCDFRAVCRFETTLNEYHHLQPMKRPDVFKTLTGESIIEDE